MKKFVEGSPASRLDARKNDPRTIGQQLPVLRGGSLVGTCDALERMLARLPVVYYKDEDSNFRKLVAIESEQLCLLYKELSDVEQAHWVDTASSFALDALGAMLGTPRRTGETDSAYKSRIKAVLPTFTGGGTIPHLKKIVAGIFGVYGITEDDVQINDGYLVSWHGPRYEYLLKLDGNALDWEGNHNGVEVGAPTYDTGRFDDALNEPSDASYVRIPDDTAFDSSSFSIWAWVHTTDVAGTRVIKIKSTIGGSWEWYLQLVNGQLQGAVKLTGSDALVDSGVELLEAGKTYFVALSYDDSAKKATLHFVEDGLQGKMIRMTRVTGPAGTGSRVLYANADIYLGKNPAIAGQTWNKGWIDHVGYVVDKLTDKLADELAYAAPGIDHYAHFNIEIANFDTSPITPDDWTFAEQEVEENKAAGIKFDGFSNGPKRENISVEAEGNHYHYTDITFTNSLNVTG